MQQSNEERQATPAPDNNNQAEVNEVAALRTLLTKNEAQAKASIDALAAAELVAKTTIENLEQENYRLKQKVSKKNELLHRQETLFSVVPLAVVPGASPLAEINESITLEIKKLLENSNSLTAFEKAKLTGLQNYLTHSTLITLNSIKDGAQISEDQLDLTLNAGRDLMQFYNRHSAQTPAAVDNILRICNLMEKRNCGQKLRAALLGAVAVVVVLGSIAALVASFGTLAPAAAALGAMGVAVSAEALGAVYGVAAVGAFLGATKLYSTYKSGLMFNTKPETTPLAAVMREDVEKYQKISLSNQL